MKYLCPPTIESSTILALECFGKVLLDNKARMARMKDEGADMQSRHRAFRAENLGRIQNG